MECSICNKAEAHLNCLCDKCYVESIIKDLIHMKELESSIDQRLENYLKG